MDNLVVGGAIIGVINAVNRQFPKVAGVYGILLAVVLGAVAGYFQFQGVENIEQGILIGLASSGVYKVVTVVGTKRV